MTVIVRDAASGKWRLYERPRHVVIARALNEVVPALAQIESQCARHRRFAAGFLSYEAAPAFDAALKTQLPDDFPLLWFGVYDEAHHRTLEELEPATGGESEERWEPSITADHYAGVFARLQELIRNGDTYQVNYTYRIRTRLQSDPFALFVRLATAQSPPFGAFVDTGEWAICSASPELFFHLSLIHI